MEKFKNYLLALLFSVLGGITAITGYEYFNDDKQTISVNYDDNIKFANYVLDTTDIIIPEGLNFIYTSKKSFNSCNFPYLIFIRLGFGAGFIKLIFYFKASHHCFA